MQNPESDHAIQPAPGKRHWTPTPRFYGSLLLIAVLAFATAWIKSFFGVAIAPGFDAILLTLLSLIALLDYLLSRQMPRITVIRELAGNLAVNKPAKITLHLRHTFSKTTWVQLFDAVPASVKQADLPHSLQLLPKQKAQVEYTLRPLQRGPLQLGQCYLRVKSPLGLWNISYQSGNGDDIKVYPDFSAITGYTILATENHTSQIGIRKAQRRGTGMEFQQLREYRLGDSLRQLDWKATSRRQQLISREYQDERDQHIVLLLDSGQRMRTQDDELSHFDHALNALLLVSFIALRQGDSVSVLSFGEGHRWIPPQKGAGHIKNLLNGMYDLHATNCTPDYIHGAEKLSALQQKRSLVVLVTNSRDEDATELLTAVNLLKQRHLVIIANLREEVLDQLDTAPVTQLNEALDYAGVQNYLALRQDVQRKLSQTGVFVLECTAKELAMKLANSYWEIKSAGVL